MSDLNVLDRSKRPAGNVGGMKGAMRHPLQAAMIKMVNSWRIVLVFYVLAIAGGAAIFCLAEEGRSYWDSLWWAFITALTIGYGDIYPVTATGRLTGIVLAHVVILVIIPLIIAHMTLRLIQDDNQFNHDEQEEIKANLAATLVRATEAERRLVVVEQQLGALGGNVMVLINHFGLEAVKEVLNGAPDTTKELTAN